MFEEEFGYTLSPVLHWAGGKHQLLEPLEFYMPRTYNRYYEPFLGGGALFFDLQPQRAVVNDINSQLIGLYKNIRDNTEDLIDVLKELDKDPVTEELYFLYRDEFNSLIKTEEHSVRESALFIYMNKRCFNGLYRVNARGEFNVSFIKKAPDKQKVLFEEDNIKNMGRYFRENDIQILNGDFIEALKDVKEGDFVFIDSPYAPISKTAEFTSYTSDKFLEEDHIRLSEEFKRLDSVGVKIMLTNNDTEFIRRLYSDYTFRKFNVNRAINSDASKRKGTEVLILNY